ncbi:MAG: hypothetical protein ABIB04_03395 [Patescibacteria group bacterium]
MKFFTPPPLKPKPIRTCKKRGEGLWKRNPVVFIRIVSAFSFGVIFFIIGLVVVVLLWRIFVNLGQPELLVALILTFFFILGFIFGTYSSRLVIYDLKKRRDVQNPNIEIHEK